MSARLTPRQYDLLLTGKQKLALFAPLLAFIVLPAVFLIHFNARSYSHVEMLRESAAWYAPLVLIIAFGIAYLFVLASLTYRITVTLDQRLVFKSRLREQTLSASELLSVEPRGLFVQVGLSGYLLKHRNGKVVFPVQFTGMYQLLSELKATNPSLEIRGI